MSAGATPLRERGEELLREGWEPATIAQALDVHRGTVELWRSQLELICERCAEPIRERVDDGLCGFCREEIALEAVPS